MGSYLNYNNFGFAVHDNDKLDELAFIIHNDDELYLIIHNDDELYLIIHNDDELYLINHIRKMLHTTYQYRCT